MIRRAGAAATALAVGSTLAAAAEPPKPTVPLEQNCFFRLLKGTEKKIDCEHPMWLTPEEREDIKKLTRGYLEDATCRVTIRIERSLVDQALAASDFTFEAPPQPVRCDLKTSRGPMPITGTFAPKVVFKEGAAVQATPGLANITGVNSYLAWPVVYYVNNAKRITGSMLVMINAYRANHKSLEASER